MTIQDMDKMRLERDIAELLDPWGKDNVTKAFPKEGPPHGRYREYGSARKPSRLVLHPEPYEQGMNSDNRKRHIKGASA